jgi:hypothetical protein
VRAPAAERIVDKMPLNSVFVGLIHPALPNARFINLRRDPLDTCVSCFSLLFSGSQRFTHDLAELGSAGLRLVSEKLLNGARPRFSGARQRACSGFVSAS